MNIQQNQLNDFGAKNIALIAIFAVVLGGLAWNQKPVRDVARQQGTSFANYTKNLYASNNTSAQVLGAQQYNEELLAQFSNIEINLSDKNSSEAIVDYATQMRLVFSSYKVDTMLSAANDIDQSSLEAKQNKFIADLKKIAVPKSLAEYHRLTLAYYSMIFTTVDNKESSEVSSDQLPVIISAAAEKIQKYQKQFKTSMQIDLP